MEYKQINEDNLQTETVCADDSNDVRIAIKIDEKSYKKLTLALSYKFDITSKKDIKEKINELVNQSLENFTKQVIQELL